MQYFSIYFTDWYVLNMMLHLIDGVGWEGNNLIRCGNIITYDNPQPIDSF